MRYAMTSFPLSHLVLALVSTFGVFVSCVQHGFQYVNEMFEIRKFKFLSIVRFYESQRAVGARGAEGPPAGAKRPPRAFRGAAGARGAEGPPAGEARLGGSEATPRAEGPCAGEARFGPKARAPQAAWRKLLL